MHYILYDIIIGLVLLVSALRGRQRGLILALCSLAAVITAFLGASWSARTFTPVVGEYVAPKLAAVIERQLPDLSGLSGTSSGSDSEEVQQVMAPEDDGAGQEAKDSHSLSQNVKQALSSLRLPAGMVGAMDKVAQGLKSVEELPATLSLALARAATDSLMHLVIFLVSFLLILLVWKIISHGLNLVARLPVLHFFNKTGGFLLGLCKGVLFCFVLAWIVRFLGNVIPNDTVGRTYLLRFFMTTDPLAYFTGM